MSNDIKINSSEYWEQRFQKNWEDKNGPAQTRFFARILLENMPSWLKNEIRKNKMSICDWGCAEGECAAELSQAFPQSKVAGVDVSHTAIDHAGEKYPFISFLEEDWLIDADSNKHYDVVVSSNTLEHFSDPIGILRNALGACATEFIVLLVPYREDVNNMDREHFFSFSPFSIPLNWGPWLCVNFSVIDTKTMPGTHWRGSQCLLVYCNYSKISELGLEFTLSELAGASNALENELKNMVGLLGKSELQVKIVEQKRETQILHDKIILNENGTLKSSLQKVSAQVKLLEAELKRSTQEIEEQTALIKNKEQIIENQKKTILKKDENVTDIGKVLEDANKIISQRDSELQVISETVKALSKQTELIINEKNQLFNRLESERVSADNKLAELNVQLNNRSAIVSNLEQENTNLKEQLNNKSAVASNLEQENTKLKELLKQQTTQIAELNSQIKNKDTATANLKLETASKDATIGILKAAREELAEIKSARSYKFASKINRVRDKFGLYGNNKTAAPKEASKTEPSKEKSPVAVSQPVMVVPAPSPAVALKELKVAAIMDTFTYSCFEPECNLITFRPDNWKKTLEADNPDFLLVESAWNGNDGSWQYRVGKYASPPGRELFSLLDWCRENSIKTVFWNKEDPPHFDNFIDAAREFDYIFTTDENCIPLYREQCGHDNIHALPFAAQPKLHNPVLKQLRDRDVCFAGTYYANRFDERRTEMELLLRAAKKYKFDIYDRMHGNTSTGYENYLFPEEFKSFIRGRLEYNEMVEAYRRYKVFLNVNSVANSKTMFSRRVFELLACGTTVVSTKSKGIEHFFGDLVPLVSSPEEAEAALNSLLNDHEHLLRSSALGVRDVMLKHTYDTRLKQVCDTIGLRVKPDSRKVIAVVAAAGKKTDVVEHIKQQQCKPDCILVLEQGKRGGVLAGKFANAGFNNVETVSAEKCEAMLKSLPKEAVVIFMSAGDYYGPGYILDAVQALDYGNTDVSGISANYSLNHGKILLSDGVEFMMSNQLQPSTIVARQAALQDNKLLMNFLAGEPVKFSGPGKLARHRFEYVKGVTSPDQAGISLVTL
jgi:spore maturation protein CgeB